eukprot:RCo030811
MAEEEVKDAEAKPTKPKTKIVVRTRKFMTNRLLNRRQFVVEVEHPGVGTVPKIAIREKLQRMFKVKELNTIVVHGFHTQFGGGKSVGFGVIYDDLTSVKQIEPRHRLIRLGMAKKKTVARKQRKEKKNRGKRIRGRARSKAAVPKAKGK